MLQPPYLMKLDMFRLWTPMTAGLRDAIRHLPTLADLSICLCSDHIDFLLPLPNLRRLELNTRFCAVRPDTPRVLSTLHSFVGLMELEIFNDAPESAYNGTFQLRFTSDELAACLAHMPLLTSLCLWHSANLRSLRFLSIGPVTRALKRLTLLSFHPRLPLAELSHVHALSALTELTLDAVFDRLPDADTLQLYRPPSVILPTLTQVSFR
jgi:hypothetical protein